MRGADFGHLSMKLQGDALNLKGLDAVSYKQLRFCEAVYKFRVRWWRYVAWAASSSLITGFMCEWDLVISLRLCSDAWSFAPISGMAL